MENLRNLVLLKILINARYSHGGIENMEQKKEKNIPLEQTLEEIKKMKAEKLAQQNTPPSIPPASTPAITVPPSLRTLIKNPSPRP